MDRRQFLKTSMASAAVLSCPGWRALAGTNEDLRIAVVGFRSRGRSHIEGFRKIPGVRVTALCDVDQSFLDREFKAFEERGEKVARYRDIRLLLEDKSIDAISVATPNHWHSLMGIWACQAGKDVYLEKPISHNVEEGRKLVEAARRYRRIVQCGTQSRSNPGMREAIAYIHEGKLGKVRWARGLCYKRRPSIGKVQGPVVVPTSIDYDLWCGPAQNEPLRRANLHYDWHWVWATGNGDLGNQGIHQMDIARWALGEKALSPSIISIGGRVGYDDDGETPNTMVTVHRYAAAPLIFEVRGLPEASGKETMDRYRDASIGVIVEGEKGTWIASSYDGATVLSPEGEVIAKFNEGNDQYHFQNFVDAVRARDVSLLHAEIEEGHLSSALCHTGNISLVTGAPIDPSEIASAVTSDPSLKDAWDRLVEHLSKNGVDANKERLNLGARLAMDVSTERFLENEAACALLSSAGRAPFTVPDEV